MREQLSQEGRQLGCLTVWPEAPQESESRLRLYLHDWAIAQATLAVVMRMARPKATTSALVAQKITTANDERLCSVTTPPKTLIRFRAVR